MGPISIPHHVYEMEIFLMTEKLSLTADVLY